MHDALIRVFYFIYLLSVYRRIFIWYLNSVIVIICTDPVPSCWPVTAATITSYHCPDINQFLCYLVRCLNALCKYRLVVNTGGKQVVGIWGQKRPLHLFLNGAFYRVLNEALNRALDRDLNTLSNRALDKPLDRPSNRALVTALGWSLDRPLARVLVRFLQRTSKGVLYKTLDRPSYRALVRFLQRTSKGILYKTLDRPSYRALVRFLRRILKGVLYKALDRPSYRALDHNPLFIRILFTCSFSHFTGCCDNGRQLLFYK